MRKTMVNTGYSLYLSPDLRSHDKNNTKITDMKETTKIELDHTLPVSDFQRRYHRAPDREDIKLTSAQTKTAEERPEVYPKGTAC